MAQTEAAHTEAAHTEVARRDQEAAETKAEKPVETGHPCTATVHLPFVTAEFRVPDIHVPSLPVRVPGRNDLSAAVSSIRSRLPSPSQTAYYAGLGLLGALGVIEWPVVIVVGVGTAIAHRQFGSAPTGFSAEPGGNGQEPIEPQEDPSKEPGRGC